VLEYNKAFRASSDSCIKNHVMVYNMMWLEKLLLDLSGKTENYKAVRFVCFPLGLAQVVEVIKGLISLTQ